MTATAAWLELLRAGDPAAAARLLEHSCERLRALASRMLRRFPQVRRWEETDDIFCEAVAKLQRSLETVRPETARHYYNLAAMQLRRVLVDFARRYYGAEGLGRHHETVHENSDQAAPKYEGADAGGEPGSLVEWTEFHEWIDRLPDAEREVFDLLWYQQLTQEEAAEILGVTTRTIRRRWQDARYALCKARLGEALPE
ncbi:MAG TPA: sigma-70 family RNA polymerase sigma factor [Pirellulales bacterium]|jgi:RNA polymerase sigma-70 factor (ECF subfamily)|nr:sigma-70 family RNA polymerase sigma factor [Pirellulales bacterium]